MTSLLPVIDEAKSLFRYGGWIDIICFHCHQAVASAEEVIDVIVKKVFRQWKRR